MFHVKHEGWTGSAAAFGIDLPPTAARQLDAFEASLATRGAAMGLVSPRDVPRIHERHLLDTLRGAALIRPDEGSAYDLGSGGGLPGVVIAIACPWLTVTLVEVRRNRAAYLSEIVGELALGNVDVFARRAETLRQRRSLCLARAFAPLPRTWDVAAPLLTPAGRLLYWAGSGFDLEHAVPAGVTARVHPARSLRGAGAIVEISTAR